MPAENTSFTATEIKAGAMVLAALVVLIGFVAAIRGCGAGRVETNTFSAAFTTIEGLNLGADVRFGGVKVGKVIDIGTDPEDRSQIRVVFEVPTDVPVNRGSVATIEQVSLTTSKHLEVSTGASDEQLHVSGDRIASLTSDDGMFGIPDLGGVVGRLESLLESLETLLGVDRAQLAAKTDGGEMVDLAAVTASLNRALSAGASTLENLDETIEENRDEIGEIVARLADLEDAASQLLANLNAAIDENRPPLNAAMVNLEQLSEEASRQVAELTASLAVTLQYLQDVGGNSSHLVEEQRPTLEQILSNLEATTRNLKEFTETIAEQPNVLVVGAKPQGREDGGK